MDIDLDMFGGMDDDDEEEMDELDDDDEDDDNGRHPPHLGHLPRNHLYSVSGLLAHVNNETIVLFDCAPPSDHPTFTQVEENLDAEQQRHLLRDAFPLCVTIRLDTVRAVQLFANNGIPVRQPAMTVRNPDHAAAGAAAVTSSTQQTNSTGTHSPQHHEVTARRFFRTAQSKEVLIRALALRFIWDHVVKIVIKKKRRRRRQPGQQDVNNNNEAEEREERIRRRQETSWITAGTGREPRRGGISSSSDDDEEIDSDEGSTATSETGSDNSHDDDRQRDSRRHHRRPGHHPLAGLTHSRTSVRQLHLHARANDDEEDDGERGNVAVRVPAAGNNNNDENNNNGDDDDDDDDVDEEELQDDELHSVFFRSAFLRGTSEGAERLVRRRFPKFQEFVGRQLIELGAAVEATEAELTFALLEAAGKIMTDMEQRAHEQEEQHRPVREAAQCSSAAAATSSSSTAAADAQPATATEEVHSGGGGDLDQDDVRVEDVASSPVVMSAAENSKNAVIGGKDTTSNSNSNDNNSNNNAPAAPSDNDFGLKLLLDEAAHMRKLGEHLRTGGGGVRDAREFDELLNNFRNESRERRLAGSQRARMLFWLICAAAFVLLAAVLLWVAVINFAEPLDPRHRYMLDLSVLLMMPTASCAILGLGVLWTIQQVIAEGRRRGGRRPPLPSSDRFRLLRFLVLLSGIITCVSCGLKWKNALDPDNMNPLMITLAKRDNNTAMCAFQVEFNCSGGTEPCPDFLRGNGTLSCPEFCGYDASLPNPSKGCAPFVAEAIRDQAALVMGCVVASIVLSVAFAWIDHCVWRPF